MSKNQQTITLILLRANAKRRGSKFDGVIHKVGSRQEGVGEGVIYIYIYTYIHTYIHTCMHIYNIFVVLVTTSMVVILKQLAETKKVSKVAKWSGTPMKHLKDIVVHKQRLSKTTPFQRILTGLPQKTDSSPG